MKPLPLLAVLALAGCGSGEPSVADQKKLRDEFAEKKFDINKVPPENRERVLAIMKANSQGGASKPAGQ